MKVGVARETAAGERRGRAPAVTPGVPSCVARASAPDLYDAFAQSAGLLAASQTYPHVDMFETGQRAGRAVLAQLAGRAGPTMAWGRQPMLPHVMRYNRTANAERQRLVAEALGHPGEDAADVLANLIAALGLPHRLADVGIGPDKFSLIATTAMHDKWLHKNPVKITSPEQILRILEAAA